MANINKNNLTKKIIAAIKSLDDVKTLMGGSTAGKIFPEYAKPINNAQDLDKSILITVLVEDNEEDASFPAKEGEALIRVFIKKNVSQSYATVEDFDRVIREGLGFNVSLLSDIIPDNSTDDLINVKQFQPKGTIKNYDDELNAFIITMRFYYVISVNESYLVVDKGNSQWN